MSFEAYRIVSFQYCFRELIFAAYLITGLSMALKIEDAHHVSSFPPILDSYLSAQASRVAEFHRQRAHHSPNRPGQVLTSTADAVHSDQVLESKQKALLDQRHLETYYRIHRLKDVLSHQYATLLREKVQRQRQEMKPHDPDDSKTTGHKGKKRGSVQRLTRSTLTHDDTYMRSLPKTRHYLVLEVQRQLTRLGCLQSRREQEVFRVWLEQHKCIYHLQKLLQATDLSSTSSPDVTLEDLLNHKARTLPKIQISPEDTTPQQEHLPVSLRGSGGGANTCQPNGKQTWGQDKTELMFPEVFTRELKVPKSSTLESTFLEPLGTNVLLVRSHEPPIRSSSTDIIRHKLRFMHNLSRFHMADTQRLMAKNGLSLQCTDGFSIKELMEYECPYDVQTQKSRCPAESDLTHLSLSNKATTESTESLIENLDRQISLQFAEKITEESSGSAEAIHSSDTDVPLCVHDLCATHAIEMESSDVKMWTNYT